MSAPVRSGIRSIQIPQAKLTPQGEAGPVLSYREGKDLAVLVPTLALVALGITMVFSASIPMAAVRQSEDIYYYLKRELLFAGVGLVAMWGASRISMGWLYRQAAILLALSTGLLVLVLFVGVRVNGAMSWLAIPGTGLRFQPSELAKLFLVIVAARYFARFPQGLPDWRRALPPFLAVGGTAVLIAVEPDMGTAAVLVLAMFVFFHIAGARFRHLAAAATLGMLFCGVMILRHPYQLRRIASFFFREELALNGGYQATHALIAMGSGGLAGRGLCGSVEKYFYLPVGITDSILAVIGEELGMIATWSVLALFAWLVCRGMAIAGSASDATLRSSDTPDRTGSLRSTSRFSRLVAAGVTCVLGTQALVNVAATTAVVPTTGVPLPFVSYGGSSLLMSLIGVGLLLNVSRSGGNALPQRGNT